MTTYFKLSSNPEFERENIKKFLNLLVYLEFTHEVNGIGIIELDNSGLKVHMRYHRNSLQKQMKNRKHIIDEMKKVKCFLIFIFNQKYIQITKLEEAMSFIRAFFILNSNSNHPFFNLINNFAITVNSHLNHQNNDQLNTNSQQQVTKPTFKMYKHKYFTNMLFFSIYNKQYLHKKIQQTSISLASMVNPDTSDFADCEDFAHALQIDDQIDSQSQKTTISVNIGLDEENSANETFDCSDSIFDQSDDSIFQI